MCGINNGDNGPQAKQAVSRMQHNFTQKRVSESRHLSHCSHEGPRYCHAAGIWEGFTNAYSEVLLFGQVHEPL